jgi:PmbA protein
MNITDKLELAHWTADLAKKQGADEAAVDVANSRDVEIAHREGKIETLKESTQNGLSINIYAGGRYSGHSTNDLRKSTLENFVGEAVAMTKYLSEDPFRALPDPKYYEGRKEMDLKTNDSNHDNLTSEARVDMAREIEEIALAQSDKILSCTSFVSDSRWERVKVHSNGFEGHSQGTSYSAGAEVTVTDGEGGRPQDWDWTTVRMHRDLPSAQQLGTSAVNRTLAKIGSTKLESGRYDMVVENRNGRRLLGALRGAMSGRALQQKASFLDGKLNQSITSDVLTWTDDPFIERGLGSRLYDDDGMPTKRRVVVDKGVLKTYFIDCYYARKLGVEPTGGSGSNAIFELGDSSLDEIIGQMERGIFITTFIGGNSNATTGDFSYGIMGQLVENGKIIKPVSEMNIAGNMNDLFGRLAQVGNDPYMGSSWRIPTLLFKDVEFSGL